MKFLSTLSLFFITITGCASQSAQTDGTPAPTVPVIEEAFLTPRDTTDDVDSPAVWHGPDGQHWLLATAKQGDVIRVHDAATGEPIRRLGRSGTGMGQLDRPNGVVVADDLAIIAERNNDRIQVFSLPEGEPLGTFGEDVLRRPYGLTVFPSEGGSYELYVTDNYEGPGETIPPDDELGERVQHFRFRIGGGAEGGNVEAEHVRAFGATSGPGVLHKVETIWADPVHDRLLIASEQDKDLKVYDLAGQFTGEIIGQDVFQYEPEGVALYACADGSGYWLTTDQEDEDNTFHLFDRETLAHAGAFQGAITANTDGVALTQRGFGPFSAGAFYAVHDDGNVAAFDWRRIAEALNLRSDCAGEA